MSLPALSPFSPLGLVLADIERAIQAAEGGEPIRSAVMGNERQQPRQMDGGGDSAAGSGSNRD